LKAPILRKQASGIGPLPVPLAIIVGLGTALLTAPAWAFLGGDTASIYADCAELGGELHSTPMTQYEVNEITSDGLIVREYSTHQGQVFAVLWRGPFKPDLEQLLGGYFVRYQSAVNANAQSPRGLHRQFTVSQPDFVVQQNGRLRAFRGEAYIPSLVPAGVSVADLQ
jgi:hypothetical protein